MRETGGTLGAFDKQPCARHGGRRHRGGVTPWDMTEIQRFGSPVLKETRVATAQVTVWCLHITCVTLPPFSQKPEGRQGYAPPGQHWLAMLLCMPPAHPSTVQENPYGLVSHVHFPQLP